MERRLGQSGNIGDEFQNKYSNQLLILGKRKSIKEGLYPLFDSRNAFHDLIRP